MRAKVVVTGNTLSECKKNAQEALKTFFESAAFTTEYGDAVAIESRDSSWKVKSNWQLEAFGVLTSSTTPATPAGQATQGKL